MTLERSSINQLGLVADVCGVDVKHVHGQWTWRQSGIPVVCRVITLSCVTHMLADVLTEQAGRRGTRPLLQAYYGILTLSVV